MIGILGLARASYARSASVFIRGFIFLARRGGVGDSRVRATSSPANARGPSRRCERLRVLFEPVVMGCVSGEWLRVVRSFETTDAHR
jgi:hypothetical protein